MIRECPLPHPSSKSVGPELHNFDWGSVRVVRARLVVVEVVLGSEHIKASRSAGAICLPASELLHTAWYRLQTRVRVHYGMPHVFFSTIFWPGIR